MKTKVGVTFETWCLLSDVKKLVEKAYKEGWYDGNAEYCDDEVEQDWETSIIFNNLEEIN